MKKLTNILTFLFLIALQVGAKTLIIDGKTYEVDTISNFQAGPGTQHIQLKLTGASKLDVFFLKVDASNPYISFKAGLGLDSIYGRERPSTTADRKSTPGKIYFAGTNADFFDVDNPPYYGYPLSGCVVDNEVARIPNQRRTIVFEEDKIPAIGLMSYTGNVKSGTFTWTIHGVNHIRGANQLILFNQHNGKVTRTNNDGTEVLIKLKTGESWGVSKAITAVVQSVHKNKGNLPIPKGYAVLSGNGTAAAQLNELAANDEIQITLNMEMDGRKYAVSQMVGSDGRIPMLYNGKVETGSSVWNELHPRTAVGYSHDKQQLIFCVVDGRSTSSVGVTTLQLAQLMKSAGAHTAFNMDGGGSSAMYIKEFGAVNNTSDGSERSVGNSLYAVSSAPVSTNIAFIKPYNSGIRLKSGESITPKFIGYDAHGNILIKSLSNVELSCSPELGSFTINTFGTKTYTFNATGSGTGLITAKYMDMTTQIKVTIVNPNKVERVSRISEDFSSQAWDAELKRLNPAYTTLTAGNQYTNVNNIDLYFDKYAFEGGFVAESNNPDCADGHSSHSIGDAAIALRLRNSGTSYLELPEMENAGTITVHVRNGNKTAGTSMPLLKQVNGNWEKIHDFSLRRNDSYTATSVDEVVSFDINSQEPIKLKLDRGDKFISIFKVEVTPFGETSVRNPESVPFLLTGRTLQVETPTMIKLYNLMGIKVFEAYVDNQISIPMSVGNGIFLMRGAEFTQKVFLNS